MSKGPQLRHLSSQLHGEKRGAPCSWSQNGTGSRIRQIAAMNPVTNRPNLPNARHQATIDRLGAKPITLISRTPSRRPKQASSPPVRDIRHGRDGTTEARARPRSLLVGRQPRSGVSGVRAIVVVGVRVREVVEHPCPPTFVDERLVPERARPRRSGVEHARDRAGEIKRRCLLAVLALPRNDRSCLLFCLGRRPPEAQAVRQARALPPPLTA
jgi:hypothetical protein